MQQTGSVLVVDDQIDIVELVVDFLKDEGFSAVGATDGLTALSMIQENPPSLLLLDMFMPDMNGIQLWQHLQEQQYYNLPIVLMTASPNIAADLLPPQAAYYLAKPFDLNQLLECVNQHLSPNQPPSCLN